MYIFLFVFSIVALHPTGEDRGGGEPIRVREGDVVRGDVRRGERTGTGSPRVHRSLSGTPHGHELPREEPRTPTATLHPGPETTFSGSRTNP